MIGSPHFAGRRYAVLGLARSGLATVETLLASGARVTAWDADAGARDKLLPVAQRWGGGPRAQRGVEGLRAAPPLASLAPLHQPSAGPPPHAAHGEDLVIADPLDIDLAGFDAVVVSPGVPINRHPIAAKAREAGVPLIGDIELFAQARAELPAHKVVGITGTNGKSTTTALVHHILQTTGVPSLMGGNIGLPILAQAPLPAGGVYVLELSSYQIDLTFGLDCDVAVLLNITPDHLDRYAGFEGYAASKRRLFAMQTAGQVAIVEPDGGDLDQSRWPALQGPHNAQNAAAAIAVAQALGIDAEAIERGLATYPGLPHRMERVATRGAVLFVNDSKATNATSTAPALAAYPAIRWILGGRAKSDDLDACAPYFAHVRSAYTIGEAGPMFARLLAPHMPVAECGMLAEAVTRAASDAAAGDVVLLSPACASFDQFTDYEARGDAFRAAVGALA